VTEAVEATGAVVHVTTGPSWALDLTGVSEASWCFVADPEGGADRLDARRVVWAMAAAGREGRVLLQVAPGVELGLEAAVPSGVAPTEMSGDALAAWVAERLAAGARARAVEGILWLGDRVFARRLDPLAEVPAHPGLPTEIPESAAERVRIRARVEAWIHETTRRTGHAAHVWNVEAGVWIARSRYADDDPPGGRDMAHRALRWGLRAAPEAIVTQAAWQLADVEPPASTRWGAEMLVRQADHARNEQRMGQALHAALRVVEEGPVSMQLAASKALARIDADGGGVASDAAGFLSRIWARLQSVERQTSARDFGRSAQGRDIHLSLCAVLLSGAAREAGVEVSVQPPLSVEALEALDHVYAALVQGVWTRTPPGLAGLRPIDATKVAWAFERLAAAGWLGGRTDPGARRDRTRRTRAILRATALQDRSTAEEALPHLHEDLHVCAEPLATALRSVGWDGSAERVVATAEEKMEPLSRLHALAARVQTGDSAARAALLDALDGIAHRSREPSTAVMAELAILRAAAAFRVRYVEGPPWAYLDRLLDHLPRATDAFATNTHFSLALLSFVDALAAATVEAATGRRLDLPALAIPQAAPSAAN
jgi:hypothetical protein